LPGTLTQQSGGRRGHRRLNRFGGLPGGDPTGAGGESAGAAEQDGDGEEDQRSSQAVDRDVVGVKPLAQLPAEDVLRAVGEVSLPPFD
jgi:hypothetical protein